MATRDFTPNERRAIQRELAKQLGPEYISYRPAAGSKVAYLESWQAISLANSMFGFDGWNSSVKQLTVDYCELTPQHKYNVGVTAIVRVELKNGSYHEDVGFGVCEGQKSKAQSLEKAKKEAVTDAMKRCFRLYGPSLGGCVYDKAYLNRVARMKPTPAEFDESQLRREGQPLVGLPLGDALPLAPGAPAHQPPQPVVTAPQDQTLNDPSTEIISEELALALNDMNDEDDFLMDIAGGNDAVGPSAHTAASTSTSTSATTNVVVNIAHNNVTVGPVPAAFDQRHGSSNTGRHSPYPSARPPHHQSSFQRQSGHGGLVQTSTGQLPQGPRGRPSMPTHGVAQPGQMAGGAETPQSLTRPGAPQQYRPQAQRTSPQSYSANGGVDAKPRPAPQSRPRQPMQPLVTNQATAQQPNACDASLADLEMESLSGSQRESLFAGLDEADVSGLHITTADGGGGSGGAR